MGRALHEGRLGPVLLPCRVFPLDLGLRVLPSAQPVPWSLPDLPGLELRVLLLFLLDLELRALLPCQVFPLDQPGLELRVLPLSLGLRALLPYPLDQPGQELRVLPLGLGLRALPLGLELRALPRFPLDQPDLPDQEGLEGLGCLHHHLDHVLGRRKCS